MPIPLTSQNEVKREKNAEKKWRYINLGEFVNFSSGLFTMVER